MSRTDIVADGITVIRNAYMAKKDDTVLPFSGLLLDMMAILKREGYIENYQSIKQNNLPCIKVFLRYMRNKPAITSIRKISCPSRRMYAGKTKIPRVGNGAGLAIVTTSKGVMTDVEARSAGVGGEIICFVV